MFTGIIECMGIVKGVRDEKGNKRFRIQSSISNELKIDQSIAHQGVCLTVVQVKDETHDVVAVAESLSKTNLNDFKIFISNRRSVVCDGRSWTASSLPTPERTDIQPSGVYDRNVPVMYAEPERGKSVRNFYDI